MNKSGIYKIVNIENNKIYIGSSKNLTTRWYKHSYHLKKGNHHCKHLQYSYNKYGKGSFTFDIIEECDISNLIVREQFYIDSLSPEYNTCQVAGTTAGRKLTEEHKRRIGVTNSKLRLTDERKAEISDFMRTRPCSSDTREKMAKAKRGSKLTQEQKDAVSKAQKGKPKSEETKEKIRKSLLNRNKANKYE
jgi:group I intron endonuclease